MHEYVTHAQQSTKAPTIPVNEHWIGKLAYKCIHKRLITLVTCTI